MAEYSDAWREFRAILATTEKKLLKKPNLPQAVQQLNALSMRIQDEDLPQHAAICHVEMAALYKKMEQPNEERKQYLVAAKLFMKAWREWKRGGSRVACHYHQEVNHFYTKAAKISINLRHFQTAERNRDELIGATSLEAGRAMYECESYPDSEEHLTKALNLLDGEFFSQTYGHQLLIQVYLAQQRWEDLLQTVDNLWMIVMKNRPKTTLGQQLLKDCEIMSLLALRKIVATASGRHKVLLENYGKLLAPKEKTLKISPENSDLSTEEFHQFLGFLSALDKGETAKARRILEQDLAVMSETAQKVADAVVDEPFPDEDTF